MDDEIEELESNKIFDNNSLSDEYKRKFILQYHENYTPWELEELLKNGKKYLKDYEG